MLNSSALVLNRKIVICVQFSTPQIELASSAIKPDADPDLSSPCTCYEMDRQYRVASGSKI